VREASSTTQWIAGRSTTGSISFGCSFARGRNRVPKPAAGMTAFMDLASPSVHSLPFSPLRAVSTR